MPASLRRSPGGGRVKIKISRSGGTPVIVHVGDHIKFTTKDGVEVTGKVASISSELVGNPPFLVYRDSRTHAGGLIEKKDQDILNSLEVVPSGGARRTRHAKKSKRFHTRRL